MQFLQGHSEQLKEERLTSPTHDGVDFLREIPTLRNNGTSRPLATADRHSVTIDDLADEISRDLAEALRPILHDILDRVDVIDAG